MRLEPRENTPVWMVVSAPVIAILISLVFSAGLIIWAGAPLGGAAVALAKGAFGSVYAITETLTRATPIMLTGLAAAVAFRARFWNIGAEGQLYCGALAATWLGTGAVVMHPALMIPFLFLIGALGGGLALLLPVVLKSKLKVDEVVTTLLLNFIILLFVGYLLDGPWKDPMSMGWPQAEPIIDEGVLPTASPRYRVHLGLIVALLSAVAVWFTMRYTVWGYEIRAVGHNPEGARFAGISINMTVLRVAMISGGLAGMAGVSEVAGTKGYLTHEFSPGFGYTGIAVAMLANLHPLGVILSALFMAGIFVGADSMGRAMNIPTYIADVMVALAMLCMLVSLMLTQYRLKLR